MMDNYGKPQSFIARLLGGLNGFGNELVNPTSGLGRAGAYISAAAGNPLGEAAIASMRDAREQQNQMLDDQYRQAQIQHLMNPPAPNNDTVNDFNFISSQLGPDAARQYLRNLGDPTVTVNLPGNRVYSGPRSGLATAIGGVPATNSPDTTPTIEDGFQYTPGPGGRANQSNWKPVGGASPNGSHTFR